MTLDKIVSSIYNDLQSGLAGFNANPTISFEQLSDEVTEKRQGVILDLFAKNLLKLEDLAVSLNCIDVDCENMVKCDSCDKEPLAVKNQAHFEIPQLISDYGKNSIRYIGSVDRKNNFTIITSLSELNNKKYRKVGKNKPYVWIDLAPNKNGMLDCFLFNTPLLKPDSFVVEKKSSSVSKSLVSKESLLSCISE
jgi:hypothetical protein